MITLRCIRKVPTDLLEHDQDFDAKGAGNPHVSQTLIVTAAQQRSNRNCVAVPSRLYLCMDRQIVRVKTTRRSSSGHPPRMLQATIQSKAESISTSPYPGPPSRPLLLQRPLLLGPYLWLDMRECHLLGTALTTTRSHTIACTWLVQN
jgi:hypothetical protein